MPKNKDFETCQSAVPCLILFNARTDMEILRSGEWKGDIVRVMFTMIEVTLQECVATPFVMVAWRTKIVAL